MDDTEKSRAEFSKIMYALAENFSAKITTDGMKIRFDVLKEYSLEQINAAARHILRTRVYTGTMPTVAEFVEAIEGSRESVEDQAQLEGCAVLNAAKQLGRYSNIRFINPVTAEVIKTRYRWGDICSMNERETTFFLKEFKELYLSVWRKRKHLGEALLPPPVPAGTKQIPYIKGEQLWQE